MHTLANHIRRGNNKIIKWRRQLQSDSAFGGGWPGLWGLGGLSRGFQPDDDSTTTTSSTPPIVVEAGGWLDWWTDDDGIGRGSPFGSLD